MKVTMCFRLASWHKTTLQQVRNELWAGAA
jgi:hypothetical protein